MSIKKNLFTVTIFLFKILIEEIRLFSQYDVLVLLLKLIDRNGRKIFSLMLQELRENNLNQLPLTIVSKYISGACSISKQSKTGKFWG